MVNGQASEVTSADRNNQVRCTFHFALSFARYGNTND